MITLSEAFKLCDITEEHVFLLHVDEPKSVWNDGHYFWSSKIRNKLDMKHIRVLKIEPCFEHFGSDFKGFKFTVAGITPEKLAATECD